LAKDISAQYNLRLISTENGLAESNVHSILRHENGFVYLGTGVGLSVFDGENVINIPTSITQDVKSIFTYGKDSIILIRDNGISIVNIHNYGFREKNFNTIIKNKIIQSTKAENYIYCASNEGLVKIDIISFGYTQIINPEIPKNVIYENPNCIVFSPRTKYIYVSHRNGIYVYNCKTEKVVTNQLNLPENNTTCGSLSYHNGTVCYKAINKQVVIFNENNNSSKIIFAASNQVSYFNNTIYFTGREFLFYYNVISGKKDSIDLQISRPTNAFAVQSENEILLGISTGLLIIKKSLSIVNIDSISKIPKNAPKHNELQKKIRFGNSLFFNIKSGIIEYDSITQKIHFHPLGIEKMGAIFNIIPYNFGHALVLGLKGYCGFDFRSKKYYSIRIFSNSAEEIISNSRVITGNYDSINSMLILCLYRKHLYIKDLKNNTERTWNGNDYKGFRTVRSLYYIGNQEYFLGANGNDGLIRFNFKTEKGKYYDPSIFSKAGNNSAIINQILPFGNSFYLATADGLLRFDPAKSTFTPITLEGNSYNDQIYGIAVIDNELYASTRNALCKIVEGNNMFKLNTYENFSGAGIPFFANGTINLFIQHHLIKLQVPKISETPSVGIVHIGHINGWLQTSGLQSIELDYGLGSLQVLFSNPEFIHNQYSVRIMYRFSGATKWQILKGFSFQTGNLGYGKHEIEFYSIYWDKKSAVQKFTIHILRPWWATIYFYIICLLGIVAAFWLIMKYQLRVKSDKKRQELSLIINTAEKERNRISRDFHDGVGTKLSTLKLISDNSRRDPASPLAQSLPNLVDDILIDVRNIINELSPQILKLYGLSAAIEAHVRLLKSQIPNIDFKLLLPDYFNRMTEEAEINIFRIVQELVNNAIKHAGCTAITIAIIENENEIIAAVSDNGIGLNSVDNNAGHGLNNVRTRTEVLHGEMTIGRLQGGGTEIKISLPLKGCLKPS